MRNTDRYYYLVEGECEKKLIEILKEQKNLIVPGKVNIFNVVQNKISPAFLRMIQENTVFILVFDTDTDNTAILEENIKNLKKNNHVKDVWLVMQVENLEDELIRSTNVPEIKYLTGSKTNREFKRDFIAEKRLYDKLKTHHFDFSKIWVTPAMNRFVSYVNSGYKVKVRSL